MQKKRKITQVFLSILLLHSMLGCSNDVDKKTKKDETKLTKTSTQSIDQSIAAEAKKKILAMEEIIDAKAVYLDQELLVAAKPEHHERFQLKSIRKKMKQQLKEMYPNLKITVCTDQKILMLLGKLETKIKNKEITKEGLKKQLKIVKSEMKSDT
ncbi:YhcN/YlaJ family sporulation lipoprotein [Bacillus sp. DX1.1]|uniref:YhcN/YlaJ family sporulation lipoprotein n=1 Tax=unclassified Bacillus (in: firmicutes) TaxID=185979 RepID=UPI00256FEB55|nr:MULTISPECIES: YhcN/YlaJ family sporulation lipoprotein [unclassified Bacillus (in: firmicutes)]MDM5157210.1 YhcN/YlaJ family sporulation lipoprotein [Bacillus sp. DX1.1]WJE81441.1 YhcN/YlaJ family sporulation lipoprotein [Bacillus sp. DX3.1]